MTRLRQTVAALIATAAAGFAACARGDTFTAGPAIGSEPTLVTTREGLAAIAGGRLTQAEIKARSAKWPEVPKRAKSSAMIPISTPEELLAVTNNLSGSYVLTAYATSSESTSRSVPPTSPSRCLTSASARTASHT